MNLIRARVAFTSALLAIGSATAWADETAFPLTHPLQLSDTTSVQRSQTLPQPNPPQPQQFAIAIGGLYTQRNVETTWAPTVQANYDATDRVQLHFMAPFVYDRLSGVGSHFGIGDIEFGARYRFLDENLQGWEPAAAVYPLVDLPTGNVHENLGTGRTHVFLPLWLSKSFGAWTPYGGGGYWFNPGPSNKDWVFALVGVQRSISDDLTLAVEVFHATSSKVGLKEQTGFDLNGRYNLTANHHVLFSIGRGLQNANETNQVTAYAAYLLTF